MEDGLAIKQLDLVWPAFFFEGAGKGYGTICSIDVESPVLVVAARVLYGGAGIEAFDHEIQTHTSRLRFCMIGEGGKLDLMDLRRSFT